MITKMNSRNSKEDGIVGVEYVLYAKNSKIKDDLVWPDNWKFIEYCNRVMKGKFLK